MFISDSEADRRLRSSRNVLTVIRPVAPPPSFSLPEPLPVLPEDIPHTEDEKCASAAGILESPDMALVRRMLGRVGRKPGIPNMPREIQATIGTMAQLTTHREAAKLFDNCHQHAGNLAHGYTNNEQRWGENKRDPNKEITDLIDEQKRAVRDLAFEKLTKALGLITDDKLVTVPDAMKMARLCKDLSGVVDKVLPKESNVSGGVHFHVWRPEMREEATYEVVNVGNGQ